MWPRGRDLLCLTTTTTMITTTIMTTGDVMALFLSDWTCSWLA